MSRPIRLVARGLVHLYRGAIRPYLRPACRFEPSCSAYALDAIDAHGVLGGAWLTAKRLCRCHPWGGAGWDPVPPARLLGSVPSVTDHARF
jgi:hypothetical protein